MEDYVFEPHREFKRGDGNQMCFSASPNKVSNDYSFYGKDGTCRDHGLTNVKCKCGGSPILCCEYDDTVGFKETVYMLKCDTCKSTTRETCIIDNVIKEWNSKVGCEPTESVSG